MIYLFTSILVLSLVFPQSHGSNETVVERYPSGEKKLVKVYFGEEKNKELVSDYGFFESGLKIDAATPGLSLTPIRETFESFCVDVIPVTILLLIILDLFVINVPALFAKDDFTSISILFNLAS